MCHPFSFIKISMVIPTEYISKQKEEFQYFLEPVQTLYDYTVCKKKSYKTGKQHYNTLAKQTHVFTRNVKLSYSN